MSNKYCEVCSRLLINLPDKNGLIKCSYGCNNFQWPLYGYRRVLNAVRQGKIKATKEFIEKMQKINEHTSS